MSVREIELHPGHWKNTGSGANGILNEVTEARKVTQRVYEILKESNVPCTYFEDNTSSNQRQNLNTLVKHHNADRDGLIVSIHLNSGGDSSKGIGTEVLYSTQKDLAAAIAKAISEASELINRGAKHRDNIAVLTQTYEPAILIEVCFVNSVVDAATYRQNFEKICQAIAKELAAYLGKTIVEKKEEVKLYQPTSKSLEDHTENVLTDLTDEKKHGEKALSKSWLDKLKKGALTESDAIGLLYVAADRKLFK